jgi:ribosomal protein L3
MLCHQLRIRQFVLALLAVSHGKGFQRAATRFGCQGSNRAGIEAATQKYT